MISCRLYTSVPGCIVFWLMVVISTLIGCIMVMAVGNGIMYKDDKPGHQKGIEYMSGLFHGAKITVFMKKSRRGDHVLQTCLTGWAD